LATKVKKWRAPAWMKPYLAHINNTGGNKVEELVNREVNIQTNLPVWVLQAAVRSQIGLLETLHEKGLLK
jgi:hypothetical protein